MTPDLDELLRLRDNASPLPWAEKAGAVFDANDTGLFPTRANRAYVVAAANAVPGLVERVRELEARTLPPPRAE